MSEENTATLKEFGLTPMQSKVYVALLRLGTVRASRVSSMIGIIRPEVYRVLSELSSKGLVQRNQGSPSTFTAASPERAVSILLERYMKQLANLQQSKLPLIQALSSYATNDIPDERFGLITGHGNVMFKIRQMISDGKHEYAGIRSRYGLKRIREDGIASALLGAKKRKLQVRVISEIDETNIRNADYLSRHFELRGSRDLMFYMDIIDRREMILGPAATDEEASGTISGLADLWTNNSRFIQGMYALFERVWKASRKHVPSTSRT